jgi:hypothetical protein
MQYPHPDPNVELEFSQPATLAHIGRWQYLVSLGNTDKAQITRWSPQSGTRAQCSKHRKKVSNAC